METVFVCSAFGGKEENLVLARRYCQYLMDEDLSRDVFCPHLFYPQFLDDSVREERERGLKLAIEHLKDSDRLAVFVRNGVLSEGMVDEIKVAIKEKLPLPQTYYDATDPSNIIELRHVPSGKLPDTSQLLAPTPFAKVASNRLAEVAKALKGGKRYEDLQDQMEAFLGPLDTSESNPGLDQEWESGYRKGRE